MYYEAYLSEQDARNREKRLKYHGSSVVELKRLSQSFIINQTEEGRSERGQPTVYQKHSSLQSRKTTYREWHVTNAERLRWGVSRKTKLWTQVPVNVGRNYNGPKVAKFLVG